jgi:hypothetical protein
MLRVMPSWSVALLVAFVGLAGALLGTFGRIAYDREADLRSRMLDAADDFVFAMMAAVGAAESADLPNTLNVRFGHLFSPGVLRDEHEANAIAADTEATDAWHKASQRLPRIRLLFEIDSAAAASAQRASDEVGKAILALAKFRAYGFEHQDDEDALETRGDRTTVVVRGHVKAATAASDDFSRAARAAILESHWLRGIRRA